MPNNIHGPTSSSNYTDEWQECEREDVCKGDLLKIEGNGHNLEVKSPVNIISSYGDYVAIQFANGDEFNLLGSGLTFYRIPAPIVHPDPEEHPVIIVRESTVLPKGSEPQKVVYVRPYYRNDIWNGAPETITDWSPAKVVPDDE